MPLTRTGLTTFVEAARGEEEQGRRFLVYGEVNTTGSQRQCSRSGGGVGSLLLCLCRSGPFERRQTMTPKEDCGKWREAGRAMARGEQRKYCHGERQSSPVRSWAVQSYNRHRGMTLAKPIPHGASRTQRHKTRCESESNRNEHQRTRSSK